MEKNLKHFLLLLVLLFCYLAAKAENYTVEVGSTIEISCTANAPMGGIVTHAFFNCENESDKQYVGFSYNSNDCKATVYGYNRKANIPVIVQYHYSYKGTYDNKIHVGHAEYTIYVSVTGGVQPTKIEFSESEVTMGVGETKKIDVILTPSNAATTITLRTTTSLGSPPGYFEYSTSGMSVEVYAKKKGTLYLQAETANGLQSICVIKSVNKDPNSVSIPQKLDVYVDETVPIDINLTPTDASTTYTWSVEDKTLLSINNNKIIGKAEGSTRIMCTTANKLTSNFCEVNVRYREIEDVVISDKELSVSLDDNSKQLSYTISPSNAKDDVSWQIMSGNDVVRIDTNGMITPLKKGKAVVAAKANNGLMDACEITVYEPDFLFVSSYPKNGATNVPSDISPTITFSLNIEVSTNFNGIELRDLSRNKRVEGTTNISGKDLIFVPKDLLDSKTKYRFYIPEMALKNKWSTQLPTAIQVEFESREWEKLTLRSSVTDKFLTYGDKIVLTASRSSSKIFYTLDGTTPTSNSNLYTGAITILKDIRLRAVAMEEGCINSDIFAMDYYLTNVEVAGRYPDTDTQLFVYEDVNPSLTFSNKIEPSDNINNVSVLKNGKDAIEGEVIVADSTIYFIPEDHLELGCYYKVSVPQNAIVTWLGEENDATSWTFSTGDFAMAIAMGNEVSAAIKTDGSLLTWGEIYQSGNCSNGSYEIVARTIPETFVSSDVAFVSAGYMHNAIIKTDGSLWMWGRQYCGEFGNNSTTGDASPTKIMDGVAEISCGGQSSAIIKNDGSLWMVGRNDFGQIGDSTIVVRKSPVKIMEDVRTAVASWCSSYAIKTDGSLMAWGRNDKGQLGDGTTDDRWEPTDIMDNVAIVSASHTETNTAAAIKTDGSLWVWGNGNPNPLKVLNEVSSVSTGGDYVVAIKNDGTIWKYADGSTEMVAEDIADVQTNGESLLALNKDGSVWVGNSSALTEKKVEGRNSSELAGLYLNRKTMRIAEDTRSVLVAKPIAINADYSTLTWNCSNESVLEVSERGVLTANAVGEADVTVTISDTKGNTYTATCHVSVVYHNDLDGIQSIVNEQQTLRAWANNNVLHISGLRVGNRVNVYDTSGAVVDTFIAEGENATRPLSTQGVYIVKSTTGTTKVLNR